MTTTPTNEVLASENAALAADLENVQTELDVAELRIKELEGRLSATTSARDMREALEKIVRGNVGNKWDRNSVLEAIRDLNLDAAAPAAGGDDLVSYFKRQIEWSRQTFGPALRTKGVIDHIRKELREIEDSPHDLSEWIDVVILAMDGFWRHGGKATALLPALLAKQRKNMARTWPDWRSMSEDGAIEHDRTKDAAPPLQAPADSDAVLREMTVPICESFAAIGVDISPENLKHFERALYERGINFSVHALTAPAAKAPAVSEADAGRDMQDAARYRHLRDHCSYFYAEGYDPPSPREFGIEWQHIDCTPDRPSMDWLIDQEIEAKRLEALADEGDLIQSEAQGGGTESDGSVEGHADPSSGRSSRASHLSRELEEAGIKPGPSDPPSQEASAPKGGEE